LQASAQLELPRKKLNQSREVSGHDFSRAAASQLDYGLEPLRVSASSSTLFQTRMWPSAPTFITGF
jgi:hypothetical protein